MRTHVFAQLFIYFYKYLDQFVLIYVVMLICLTPPHPTSKTNDTHSVYAQKSNKRLHETCLQSL